ncbi:hypothetical protein [Phreatobacter oligotrophus]|jgi:hypothetical protein|uniref:hypothetical protein n=1 Tax=Phreatobacter oligotrophus TaxID=1122261 RepID=UPI00235390CF|nr:hypothetical protein [Phreatobacter oligotrophus]MBX9988936.1 hypothetical protein [Phreatobacter oligotrophus]
MTDKTRPPVDKASAGAPKGQGDRIDGDNVTHRPDDPIPKLSKSEIPKGTPTRRDDRR